MPVLEFTMTMDDLVAFNRFHRENSPTARRIKRYTYIVLAFITAGVLFFLYPKIKAVAISETGAEWPAVVTIIVWIILFLLLGPILKRRLKIESRISDRLVLSQLKEGTQKGVIGSQRLILQDDGLSGENDIRKSFTKYAAVERIAEDVNYVFVYVNAMAAHVIPRREVDPVKLADFLVALRAKIAGDITMNQNNKSVREPKKR